MPNASSRDSPRRMGVEEELLLVDAEDGRPRAVAALLLSGQAGPTDRTAGATEGSVAHELQQQQLEIRTPPTADLSEVRAELVRWRRRADELARTRGSRIAALATSPLPVVPQTTLTPRYQAMVDHLGITTAEQLACGCHVHVDIGSRDEGVAVLDRIRGWLPVLVALSANSPYWQGQDSRYASFRTQVWHRFPTSGPTPLLADAAGYDAYVGALLDTRVPLDAGMIYFDARLSARYPTVEIRVADVCLHVDETLLVAALARALVETAARAWRAGRPPLEMGSDLIRLATWRASRYGLTDRLIDPGGSAPAPAWDVVDRLIEHVRPVLAETGDDRAAEARLEVLRREGTGAERQRRLVAGNGDLAELVRSAVRISLSD